MKKIISFSLWGNDYRYLGGALQNVELAKYFYPDWICRFYIGKSTNDKFTNLISNFDNVEIVKMNEDGDWTGMFWRFFAASDDSVDIMISRDTDSRIHQREVEAVNEWISSDKDFHIMRDNPNHNTAILGGMWGARNQILKNIVNEIKNYNPQSFWQTDQIFLRNEIYQKIKNNSFIHDEYFKYENDSKKFPNSKRNQRHFIGQAYDGDGKILDFDEYFQSFLYDTEKIKIKTYNKIEII